MAASLVLMPFLLLVAAEAVLILFRGLTEALAGVVVAAYLPLAGRGRRAKEVMAARAAQRAEAALLTMVEAVVVAVLLIPGLMVLARMLDAAVMETLGLMATAMLVAVVVAQVMAVQGARAVMVAVAVAVAVLGVVLVLQVPKIPAAAAVAVEQVLDQTHRALLVAQVWWLFVILTLMMPLVPQALQLLQFQADSARTVLRVQAQ
jgi:hypothetical protein